MPNDPPQNVPDDWKLEWKDPPELRRRGGNLAKSEMIDYHVEMLRERPGEWAVVRHSVKDGAAAGKPFRVRGCQLRVAAAEGEPGLFDVWARWPPDVQHF
jgi:hypothetical protein